MNYKNVYDINKKNYNCISHNLITGGNSNTKKSNILNTLNTLNMRDGHGPLIIHICGASGSGKTTLGNKLKDTLGDAIIVKDIDNLRHEFIYHEYGGYNKMTGKIDKNKYQLWIDKYIEDNKTKPIIFVGLNHMPWWHKKHYYDMHSNYRFYIKLDDKTIFKQKCGRLMENLFVNNRDMVINDLIVNDKKTIKNIVSDLKTECGYQFTKKQINMWNNDYKSQGYKFMTGNDIYNNVTEIITKYLNKILI